MTRTAAADDRYKWTVLANTTIGIFMAMLDSSIVLISLPAIFRGIDLDPLDPGNVGYLLWMLQGYLVVTAVLVVTLGRLGDMFGRVRMYNAGFAIFTLASIGLSLTWSTGTTGAREMIVMRLVQGVGGALLMANSTAILTDAFPLHQRGRALGLNMVAGFAGSFVGLILGGVLANVDWRLIFWVNVPFGVAGTLWAYLKLREVSRPQPARIDWWGNLTFALGLVAILLAVTYGIQPHGGNPMGWTNPGVVTGLVGGVALLALFAVIESRTDQPMFDLRLLRIRAFLAGNVAAFLSSVGRGGLQIVLIVWLQGLWLPLHGYSFEDTPLWAGVYLLPLTVGFLLAGPICGALTDRYGARPFATGGMVLAGTTFALLMALPTDFGYPAFGTLLLLNGVAFGAFASPNTTAVMNAAPAAERGAASGMRATSQNTGMVLAVGFAFSFLIVGLSSTLPGELRSSLVQHHVPAPVAEEVAALPPSGTLFAAFLGDNPMRTALGPHLGDVPARDRAALTSKTFFPELLSGPFRQGLRLTFAASLLLCVIAAVASWLRGGPAAALDPVRRPMESNRLRAPAA